jgi:hypothetical protein
MNEKLITLFNRIKADSGLFTVSEAQTSQGIVLPILNNLGWDVFDTSEVTPEYSIGGRRVDFALRIHSVNKVFLEIKKTSENLENHQEQLVYYAFQQGVKLAILTNGITWQFYLPLEEGSWEQRRFFTIDLIEQPVEDAAEKFDKLLSKNNIENGTAYQNAKSLYEGRQKNKIIRENLPKAWQKLISEPDEMLVELINDTLEKISGYKAEDSQIIEFLSHTFTNLNIVPTVSRNRRPNIQNVSSTIVSQVESSNEIIKLNTELLSDLSFTKIIDGKFANIPITRWRGLLNVGLKIAFDRGIGIEVLQRELKANLKAGKHAKDGFSNIKGTNISLQGQEANDTANNALKLAKLLNCEIYVLFEWREKGKFPMKQGLVHWKP